MLLAIVLGMSRARADEDGDKYLQIVDSIQQADSLNAKGQTATALARYTQAQAALQAFHRAYPYWDPNMVAYRSKYLGDKIQECLDKTAAPADKPASSPPATDESAAVAGQVKLLEAGAQPRVVLRLHPKPGDKQTLTMRIQMAQDMKMGEVQSPAMKIPPMLMTMDVSVREAGADGSIKYDMVLTDATVADEAGATPQMVEAMKASLSGLKGLTGTGSVTSRGISAGADIKAPAGADPQIRQAVEQAKESMAGLATPLPEEAVGPGAKWEAKMPLKSSGMTFEQTTTYELASLQGEQAVVKTIITQTASPQKVQNPAMPGLKLDLTKMTGTGTGEVTFDLGHLLPRSAKVDSHTDLVMGMNVGAQKQTISTGVDIHVQIEAQ